MVRLGDVCDILNGYAFKSEEYSDSGFRIIRISNVQKGYVEDTTPVFYPEDNPIVNKYELFENDLLLSLTGNVGRVALLEKEFLPAALNQRVACLRPKKGTAVRTKYLFHILNSDAFEKACILSSKGLAQKNMSTEWLKDYLIPLPSLEKQDEISETLNKVDELISLRKRQMQKLDDLIKSRFVEMFGTYPANEKGWSTGTIRDLVTEVRYGSSRKAAEGDSGKYPYLRMNNITYGGELDLSDTKTIDIPEEELDKCTVHRGDLLFNRTNSKELVGKTCVYNRDDMMVLAGFVVRVRLNEKALPEF
ncbi:MAG: restriction endonuclease subunit S, partial [Clostridia bacterium]|nr:restriction endonuclease subunit S [Clostridia bacterium]